MLIFLPPAQFTPSNAAKDAKAILEETQARMKAVQEAYTLHISLGLPRSTFDPHLKPLLDDYEARLKTETRPEVRQALLVARLSLMPRASVKITPELRQQAVKEVPPTSPAWSLQPNLLLYCVSALEDETAAEAYLAEAREKNPDLAVRGPLVYNQFEEALYEKNDLLWKAALARLDKEYPKEPYTKEAHRTLESAAKTAQGALAPAFSIQSLDDPKVTFTNAFFKGRYLLIDFWATWCGPCRGEMPMLQAAYGKFKGKGLQVLSLSFDQKAGDVAPFRADAAHPMPWNHAFVEGGFRSPLADAFGVRGIPKPVLVGPDGKILASENDLRGENLEKTLEKFLGKPTSVRLDVKQWQWFREWVCRDRAFFLRKGAPQLDFLENGH